MDKLLRKLISPVAVSGRETAVSEIIAELAAPYGEVVRDRMGNLVVHRPGFGRRIMVAAHMDSIGVMVTYIDEKGFARFANLGGMQLVPMIGQRVRFESGVIGVISAERGVELKELKPEHLFIDTAGEPVAIGDTAAFCAEPVFAGKKVISPYLDNRLGCAVTLRALELLKDTENEIFFVFTVQEEVGCRGAQTAAWRICPDIALILEGTTAADLPSQSGGDKVCCPGKGPVIPFMDGGSVYDHSLFRKLTRLAEEKGIPWQTKTKISGGTDASAIQRSRAGARVAAISAAVRNIHSPSCVFCLADMQRIYDLALAFLEAL